MLKKKMTHEIYSVKKVNQLYSSKENPEFRVPVVQDARVMFQSAHNQHAQIKIVGVQKCQNDAK